MPIFAIEDALTGGGGGIVGGGAVVGVLALARGLYLLWEKWSKRKTEAAREDLALEETRIKLAQMARTELGVAYEEERQARKSAHDADIRAIRREIEAYQTRLTDIEGREKTCQSKCAGLEDKCSGLQKQNTEQAEEIAELRKKIAELEKKLKDNGALPGTGPHAPLGGW